MPQIFQIKKPWFWDMIGWKKPCSRYAFFNSRSLTRLL